MPAISYRVISPCQTVYLTHAPNSVNSWRKVIATTSASPISHTVGWNQPAMKWWRKI